ncbi:MAG: nucleoside-diphosphate kinase [Dehalococcoidia bacterium]|nr:nucleoside-diphosphate kinase [Dehalococcoidia bacterium]
MVELQRTLVLVKPDAMQRGLAGEIISRLERRGLRIVGMKLIAVPRALAEEHYAEHKGKGFYSGLVEYICSSPILAAVFEGPSAVKAVRQTVGKTNPVEAMPGTIRADLGLMTGRNLIHASDEEPGSAPREVALWFKPEELAGWSRELDRWYFEED